jgi:nucleoside-diphosphate-sugar epimerase
MITLLGAGGSVANHMVPLLTAQKKPFRLVSRSSRPAPAGAESLSADLADRDETIRAVAGSSIVVLLAGLKYDHRVWAELWPRIMANAIEASKRAGAKRIFFDNVYMYGRVDGAMTEQTPFNPCSRKGEIRARIATTLIDAWKSGVLSAMIAPFSKNQKASWLADDAVRHSLTFTPDAARSLLTLMESDTAWNQTWHLPTTNNPPTGKEFIAMAAAQMGVAAKYRVLNRPMIRVYGWFKPVVAEMYEMLYQYDAPYLFDSSKFARAFGSLGTPYDEGIRATAVSYRKPA